MNLLKSVFGPWESSQRPLKQDLDTLQSTINSLAAQLTTAKSDITALQTALASRPAVVSATGLVTPARQQNQPGLQQVTAGAGLSGFGTPTSPLNANVDNVTITIDSNNRLAGAIGIVKTSVSSFTGLKTTPLTLVAGVSNVVLVPLFFNIFAYKAAGAGWTNGGNGFYVCYTSTQATNQLQATINLALNNAGTIKAFGWSGGLVTGNVGGVTPIAGQALCLTNATADITAGGGATVMSVGLLYYQYPWSSF